MKLVRLSIIMLLGVSLVACGAEEETKPEAVSPPEPRKEVVTKSSGKDLVQATAGGVSVSILPENPTSSDCLIVAINGAPGRSAVVWSVNGSVISQGSGGQICPGQFQRDDTVTVEVGTKDQGATASVVIGNSPPRVVDISSTPDEIFAGIDIMVEPVAEDIDGDEVSYTYQWFINGEENPNYIEAILPGSAFSKGDELQVLITPNDFYEDGPVYESYATSVPNAAPRIVSEPPTEFKTIDYRYQVEVSDPDDTQFTFRLDEGPEGMEIDPASGLIRWSLADVEPGEYTIAIIVTDPEGAEGAQEYTLTLGAPE